MMLKHMHFINLQKYNLETDQNDLNHFITVNQAHWEAFQQNQLTKLKC